MTKKHFGLGLLSLLALVFVNLSSAAVPEERILVKVTDKASAKDIEELDEKFGSDLIEVVPELRIRVLTVPSNLKSRAIERLSAHPQIEYAEADAVAHAFFAVNDTYFGDQWGLQQIEARHAWDAAQGNKDVTIAILDTGIDVGHGDLKDKVLFSKNFTTSKTTGDKNGHGTHVAGIAAAVTNNAKGVAGIGFKTSLMNVKVLTDNGSGYYSWIAKGITHAADNGAEVINLSLGGSAASQALQDAIDYAVSKNVLVVAAAGNGDSDNPTYPAFYENVLAVAATDAADDRATFSNYGAWVDVAAPGVNILSTYPRIGPRDRYAYMSGTSMAAPFVSGLAALLYSASSTMTNAAIREQIELTVDPLTDLDFGRINAAKAVGAK